MFELIAPFTVGFVGSAHCLGMCGPLVLAYSLHIKGAETDGTATGRTVLQSGLLHHLCFHLGRIFSYGFLGVLGAMLFHAADPGRLMFNITGTMSVVGGAFMVYLGLTILNILPMPAFLNSIPAGSQSISGRLFSRLFRSRHLGSKFLLGIATGFLPCGLSWAMIAKAATTENMAQAFLTMAAFGLGTVPALFLTGLSASVVSLKVRYLGARFAALSVIVMGCMLVFKGAGVFA